MINGVHNSNIAIDARTAIDYIEPQLDIRTAQQSYIRVLESFATRIGDALHTGDMRAANTAFWGCAYALGVSRCAGVSMTKRASFMGVTRATISKLAQDFTEKHNLPPSFYMKSAASHRPYSLARKSFIANGSHKKFTVQCD